MNSPWAMLMTPIWPKMIASPSAISTNTENRIKPGKALHHEDRAEIADRIVAEHRALRHGERSRGADESPDAEVVAQA